MAFKRVRFRVPTFHALIDKGEHFAHMAYLGAVGWEAHGYYQKGAIVLLGFVVLHLFVHDGGEA